MFLVVMFHSVGQFAAHGWYLGPWAAITQIFDPLRMPLFFVLSGLFARKALAGSWSSLLERRVWVMAWLLLLWAPLIEAGARFADTLSPNPPEEYLPYWQVVLEGYLYPMSNLWFVAALGLYAIASKLMRHIPPVIQIGFALAIYIWAPLAEFHWVWDRITTMFVFYLIGMYLGNFIRAAAQPAAFVAAGAVMTYLLVLGSIKQYSVHELLWQTHPYLLGGINFAIAVFGMVAAVLACGAVASHPAMRGFTYIGRNTLPVYLVHDTLLRIMANLGDWVMTSEQSEKWHIGSLPLIAAILATALALAFRRLADRVGLYWLFVRPRFLTQKFWQEFEAKHAHFGRHHEGLAASTALQVANEVALSRTTRNGQQPIGEHHESDSDPNCQRQRLA